MVLFILISGGLIHYSNFLEQLIHEQLLSEENDLKRHSVLMAECEGSARERHLHNQLLPPVGNKAFDKDVRNAIRLGENGQPSGNFLVMLVCLSDDWPAGFIWARSAEDLKGTSCIEMFIVHVAQSMRGKGGGGMMVTMVTEVYKSHRIIARSYPASERMNKMLRQRGFEVMGTSERGANISACSLPELLVFWISDAWVIFHRNDKVLCSLSVIHLYC